MTELDLKKLEEIVDEKVSNSHQGISASVSQFGALVNYLVDKQKQNESRNFWDKALRYWPLILAFVGILISWISFGYTDADAQKRILSLENRTQQIDTDQNLIQAQLSQIQTDIQWIKNNLK